MPAPSTRVRRRPVHGVLLLDKPLGLSSNQALQKAKWLLCAEKAGHTGTLDPLATGVLPLCFGAATKFSQLHLDADKTYEATLKLGQITSTGDAEGVVLQERPVQVDAQHIAAVLQQFLGQQQQIPPMYSALKKDGKPLYEYARAGQTVERAARSITVFSLELLPVPTELAQEHPAGQVLKIRAAVSKGTYIRTLAQDIGEALGCGAHLIGLRRTQTGIFSLDACITLPALEALPADLRLQALQPPDILLHNHVPVELNAEDAGCFLSGMRRRGAWADGDQVRVYGPPPSEALTVAARVFLGAARVKAGELIPERLLNPVEIQQMFLASPSGPSLQQV